jgi:nucleoside-diphosphate-sugar epimerase
MKDAIATNIQEDCRKSAAPLLERLEPLRNSSVLVTGGTGFMGKWLAEAVTYLNKTHDFKVVLYLLSRNLEAFRNTVPHLARKDFIHLVEADVRNVRDLPSDISYIIHAAATPDRREHATQPLRVIETIYKGTVAVLDASLRLPVLNKILYISSNNVYGTVAHEQDTIAENAMGYVDSNSINAAYAEAKRLAETICAVYRNQQKLPVVTVRPFAFTGPYQDLEKPWAMNNFMRDAILGGPIRILGNENTVRSYLYGSDTAFWLLAILASSKQGNTYNIGSEEGVSMTKLAQKIAANFHQKIDILNKSAIDDKSHFSVLIPNLATLKKDIPVKQVISLDEAIKRTLSWYQEYNGVAS